MFKKGQKQKKDSGTKNLLTKTFFKKKRKNQKKESENISSNTDSSTTSELQEESEECELDDKDKDKLQLMIDYIIQDACEKADEIDTKTGEMFLIEKAKHFEEEYAKVYEHYEKMETKCSAMMHRSAANAISKGRLFVLRSRANYVLDMIDDARHALETVNDPQDPKYARTMKLLILEGLLMLLEPKVMLRVRNKDRSMVQSLLQGVKYEYTIHTEGKELELILDEMNLPLASKGGVILFDPLNRIVVTNTLTARLDAVAHKVLPEIRRALWNNEPLRIMDYMDEEIH